MKQVCIALAASALLLLGLAAGPAEAQQLERSVQRTGDSVRFTIRFRDNRLEPRVLRFDLPAGAYEAAQEGLAPLDKSTLKSRIEPSVQAYLDRSREDWHQALASRLDVLAQSLPQGMRMTYGFDDGRLRWQLQGRGVPRERLEQVSARLKARIEQASRRLVAAKRREARSYAAQVRDQVYEELNYVRDPSLGDLLRPNYRRIARDAAPILKPVAEAITEQAGLDARAQTALALTFLQSIPYDRLTDRDVTDGTGFAVPGEMLAINLGDCDSKATALAGLMRHFAPEVDTAMILLPGHAVLAAELPPLKLDKTIELRGKTFVLMEPAGPGIIPLGQVDPRSWAMLRENGPSSVVWMNG